jgi:branched-chain amino acid aminotransferase
MTSIYYVDGEFLPSEQASVPVTDLTVLRGYGIFDFLRTYGGRPFHLDAHLQRLARSAELVELDLPHSLDEIRDIIMQTLARNNYPESTIRIIVTGGDSPNNLVPAGGSRLLVLVGSLKPHPPEWFSEGVKIISNHTERYLPEAKTINYIPAIVGLKRAAAQDAMDAIYIDRAGNALEGTTTNIFAFFGQRLVTPSSSVLNGITRNVILELASAEFEVEESALHLDDLLRADEVFIASSTIEVCPVRQIDHSVIGPPGPHTCRLMDLFSQMAADFARGS